MGFGVHTIAMVTELVAFAFLLIATLSVPVTTSIFLADYDGYQYGVLGYCKGSSCSSASASYKPSTVGKGSDWKMSSSARDTLGSILIVTPVAAFLCLISVLLLFIGHFRACSVSGAYWVIVLISTVVAFLASVLICIVVFLCFWPHLKWPGYILIGSGVLSLVTLILSVLAMKFASDDAGGSDLTSMDPREGTKLDLLENSYDGSSNNFTGGAFKGPTTAARSVNSFEEKKSLNDFSNPYQSSYNQSSSSFNHINRYETSVGVVTGNAVAQTIERVEPQRQAYTGFSAPTVQQNTQAGSSSVSLDSEKPKPVIPQIANPYDDLNGDVADVDDEDDEDEVLPVAGQSRDVIADDDSDFTSVSQRAANPRYYQNSGPQQRYQGSPYSPYGSGIPPQQQQQQQQQQPYLPKSSSYYPQNSPVLMQQQQTHQMPPQQYAPQRQQYQPQKPRVTDVLLNNNPDFTVGANRNVRKYGVIAQARGGAPAAPNYPRRSSGSGYPSFGTQF